MNKKLRKRKIKALMKVAIPEDIVISDPVFEREYESDQKMQEGLSDLSEFVYDQNQMLADITGLGIRDIAAIFDPTGVLSIPDVEPAIDEYDSNPTLMNGIFMLAAIISVIPIIWYFGKMSKVPRLLNNLKSQIIKSKLISKTSKTNSIQKIDKAKITIKSIIASEKAVENLADFIRPVIREGYSYGTHTIGDLGKKRNANTLEVLDNIRDSGGLAISTMDYSRAPGKVTEFEATIIPWGHGSAEDIARRMVNSIDGVPVATDKSPEAIRNFAKYLVKSEPTLIIEFPGKMNATNTHKKEFQKALGSIVEEIDLSKVDVSKIQKKFKKGRTVTHILPKEYIVGVISGGKIIKF